MKNSPVIYTIIAAFLFCTPRDNPYDPGNPSFVNPSFTLRMHFFDGETLRRLAPQRIFIRCQEVIYNTGCDSSGIARFKIYENKTADTLVARIAQIQCPGYLGADSAYVTLKKDGADTDIVLWSNPPHPALWDHTRSNRNKKNCFLVWRQSLSPYFSAYMLVRTNLQSDSSDTIITIKTKKDTTFIDSTITQTIPAYYRIGILSIDSQYSFNQPLPFPATAITP
jgi:hypothetical protein